MQDAVYHIPVRSHVKKYLQKFVDISPFKVTTHNEFGTLLYMCIEQSPVTKREPAIQYNDRMLIRIPKCYVEYQGVYISNKKIVIFNDLVEKMMIKELHLKLQLGNKKIGDIKRIINEFRETYGINDTELEYHNLRKGYNRACA